MKSHYWRGPFQETFPAVDWGGGGTGAGERKRIAPKAVLCQARVGGPAICEAAKEIKFS